MNSRFIYDEKTSSLYAPDGTFLKTVSCPKAKHWNQLIVEDGEDRWRKCEDCKENVINLDTVEADQVIQISSNPWSSTCIHASKNSDRVIYLKDIEAVPSIDKIQKDVENKIVIKTVRTIADINRAAAMGYSVDVRQIKYDTSKLRSKMTIGQDPVSGRIRTSGDYRMTFRDSEFGFEEKSKYKEILPFFSYYPYFQPEPIAAYLIPKGTADGTKVVIEDPIEDFVGSSWNQGECSRAFGVIGHVVDMKVVINESDIYVQELIG